MNKETQHESIDKGFTKIYDHYERLNRESLIDKTMRKQVYNHICNYLKPKSKILELNSGSGIDAVFFASHGYDITATDISKGSEDYIKRKANSLNLKNLNFQKCSFLELKNLSDQKYNYAFSNFGGLNCTDDLEMLAKSVHSVLKDGAMISLIVMGKYYPWDWIYIFKGKIKRALIRLKKEGADANIEGETIRTFYHTPRKLQTKFKPYFDFVSSENLGLFYPSVNHTSLIKYKKLIKIMIFTDALFRNLIPTGIGDYYIITFKRK